MRNQSFITVIATNFALVLFAWFAAPQLASAQKPSPGQEPVNKSCTKPNKVEVSKFTVTPSLPRDGDSVSVKMLLRSWCPSDTKPISVDWDIGVSRNKLAGGTVQLNPGETREFTAQWTARAGDRKIHGGVTNDLGEAAGASTDDNRREASFNILKYVTQWLEPLKAKAAGAQFIASTADPIAASNCSVSMTGLNDAQLGAPDELVMRYVCSSDDHYYYDACMRFEAYYDPTTSGFLLKNGWKVKSITRETRQGSWSGSWVPGLAVGSRDLYTVGNGCARRNGGKFESVVKIQIEGPEGTNPYQ